MENQPPTPDPALKSARALLAEARRAMAAASPSAGMEAATLADARTRHPGLTLQAVAAQAILGHAHAATLRAHGALLTLGFSHAQAWGLLSSHATPSGVDMADGLAGGPRLACQAAEASLGTLDHAERAELAEALADPDRTANLSSLASPPPFRALPAWAAALGTPYRAALENPAGVP